MSGTLPKWLEAWLVKTGPGEGTQWEFKTSGTWDWWAAGLLLAVAAVFVAMIYRRESRRARPWLRLLLGTAAVPAGLHPAVDDRAVDARVETHALALPGRGARRLAEHDHRRPLRRQAAGRPGRPRRAGETRRQRPEPLEPGAHAADRRRRRTAGGTGREVPAAGLLSQRVAGPRGNRRGGPLRRDPPAQGHGRQHAPRRRRRGRARKAPRRPARRHRARDRRDQHRRHAA